MAELDEVLGALLSSLAHARRRVDEETSAIAEYYKDNPLLEGMSVPRIRVPELVLELPMLIESHDAGAANVPQETSVIAAGLTNELQSIAQRENIELDAQFLEHFNNDVTREIDRLRPRASKVSRFPVEVVERSAERSFFLLIRQGKRTDIRPDQLKRIANDLRNKAKEIALKKSGKPPTIEASVLTADVKERAGAGNVARLRIVMREEGLEWSVTQESEGTHTNTLTPE